MGGNRRIGRQRQNQQQPLRSRSIPRLWLTCPTMGQPISNEAKPNLFFIPMKTPLKESVMHSLNSTQQWTPAKAVEFARQRVPNVSSFLAINVAQKHEIVNEEDWAAVNAS